MSTVDCIHTVYIQFYFSLFDNQETGCYRIFPTQLIKMQLFKKVCIATEPKYIHHWILISSQLISFYSATLFMFSVPS